MAGRYSKDIKKRILFQNIMIGVCLVAVFVFLYLRLKPVLITYALKDECGPIGGTVSHTIDEEGGCQNACRSACESYGHTYYSSKFEFVAVGCHNCTCVCRK